jgi:hypothetical protein
MASIQVPCRVLTTFKLEGEVKENGEKWGDFWEKLIVNNPNVVLQPL